jgi:hypothetical protein
MVDDKRRVKKIFSGDDENAKANRQQRKRRWGVESTALFVYWLMENN